MILVIANISFRLNQLFYLSHIQKDEENQQ